MGARDVLGRNELDRINEKSIDLNGYFGSVWSGLDLVLAVTPSARLRERDLGLALFIGAPSQTAPCGTSLAGRLNFDGKNYS